MVTCPHCKHQFKVPGVKKTKEQKEKSRHANAWRFSDEILKDYNSGYAILWLARKYESDKRIIRGVLKEKGVQEFRGRKGIPAWNKGLNHIIDERILKWSGPKNKNWKGGITELNMKVRRCKKYSSWVGIILRRDNYTCTMCSKRGGNLEVDHYPVLFSEIMEGIKSYKDAILSDILWDTNNGRTLCKACHNTTRRSFNISKTGVTN